MLTKGLRFNIEILTIVLEVVAWKRRLESSSIAERSRAFTQSEIFGRGSIFRAVLCAISMSRRVRRCRKRKRERERERERNRGKKEKTSVV